MLQVWKQHQHLLSFTDESIRAKFKCNVCFICRTSSSESVGRAGLQYWPADAVHSRKEVSFLFVQGGEKRDRSLNLYLFVE